MALVVGGVTVTGTQTLDASKLTGTASAINGSNITNLPAPSSSNVGSATSGLALGAVGTYAMLTYNDSFGAGSNYSGNLNYSNTGSNDGVGGAASGTWKAMGYSGGGGSTQRTSVWLRVS